MINNQDISAIGAELLSQRAAQHKEQLTQMRKLRSRLKAACNLTEEELAACGVRVKKNEHAAGGYHTDSSDEHDEYARSDLAIRAGAIRGISRALEQYPSDLLESLKNAILDPAATIESYIELLAKLAELPDILDDYQESLEGLDEEEKGEEVGKLVATAILNFASPSKAQLLNKLAKIKLGKAAVKVGKGTRGESLKGLVKWQPKSLVSGIPIREV